MSCFVPECLNSVGVPFPDDENWKQTWLESLNLACSEPEISSFVCYDHFKKADLIERNTLGVISLEVKAEAVPTNLEKDPDIEFISVSSRSHVCRICLSDTDLKNSLTDCIEGDLTIKFILCLCVVPLECANDNLPQQICTRCLSELKVAYKFRIRCLETDAQLRKVPYNNSKRKSNDASGSICKKVCTDDKSELGTKLSKVLIVKEENEAEGYQNKSNKSLQSEPSKEPAKPASSTETASSAEASPEKVKRNVTKIHIVNNDEPEITEKASTKHYISAKKAKEMLKERNILVPSLPKGIKIKPADVFESKRGMFSSKIIKGLYDTSFILSNGYLFILGLLKNNTRQLQCVLSTCRAQAEQKRLASGLFEDIVTIKSPHNHTQAVAQVLKKQMFFHVMTRRMQHDKSLNIRSIYEEVCSKDPELRSLVPLRNVINEICRYQSTQKIPNTKSFEQFHDLIEKDCFSKLHFTHSGKQFYQEKFSANDGSLAVVFSNVDVVDNISDCKIMYVDSSFKIETKEEFNYQLITTLVWVEDSYYPILFALVNKKTQEIFRLIFKHLHDILAPKLRPHEIITDYEAQLYYALGETYLDSHIGGSVFYYTQNIYKKLCSLNLSQELETNSFFRNIYHMLLMLPLLPVNTIIDGFNNIEVQAKDAGLSDMTDPVFEHITTQWIETVTPDLFCVHQLENRINENVIAPFKKLRDFLLITKGKSQKHPLTIINVVEKLKELEAFLRDMYSKHDKKAFARDLSSSQKKNVVRAWQYIENHPKINLNSFFTKVLGYIKCMENQLWIWGFYRFEGETDDTLINASNFSMVPIEETELTEEVEVEEEEEEEYAASDDVNSSGGMDTTIVMEAVIDENGSVVLQSKENVEEGQEENTFLNYVYD